MRFAGFGDGRCHFVARDAGEGDQRILAAIGTQVGSAKADHANLQQHVVIGSDCICHCFDCDVAGFFHYEGFHGWYLSDLWRT